MIVSNNFENITTFREQQIVDALCKNLLLEDKKNNIYAMTQYTFAYHSNKMEGSTLGEDQTKNLFLTGTLPQSDNIYC